MLEDGQAYRINSSKFSLKRCLPHGGNDYWKKLPEGGPASHMVSLLGKLARRLQQPGLVQT
jgi:hypothetical protein